MKLSGVPRIRDGCPFRLECERRRNISLRSSDFVSRHIAFGATSTATPSNSRIVSRTHTRIVSNAFHAIGRPGREANQLVGSYYRPMKSTDVDSGSELA